MTDVYYKAAFAYNGMMTEGHLDNLKLQLRSDFQTWVWWICFQTV